MPLPFGLQAMGRLPGCGVTFLSWACMWMAMASAAHALAPISCPITDLSGVHLWPHTPGPDAWHPLGSGAGVHCSEPSPPAAPWPEGDVGELQPHEEAFCGLDDNQGLAWVGVCGQHRFSPRTWAVQSPRDVLCSPAGTGDTLGPHPDTSGTAA